MNGKHRIITKAEQTQILALCVNALEGSPEAAKKLRTAAEKLAKHGQPQKAFAAAGAFGGHKSRAA